VYIDVNNNIAGINFKRLTGGEFYFGDETNEKLTKIDSEVEINDDSTMIIGMRTTMECISATAIQSIQFIYISKDKNVCRDLIELPDKQTLITRGTPEPIYCDKDSVANLG